MTEERASRDNSIAIIVIVAGLLTGAVLTYVFLRPDESPRYSPEYPVAQSQRVPLESGESVPNSGDAAADVASEPDASEREPSATEAADRAAPTADSAVESGEAAAEPPPEPDTSEVDDASREDADAADSAAIEGARKHMDAEGVTEYAELTEDLFVRVSAKMVIDAAVISREFGEDADPTEVQHLMAEKAAERLAGARVDPEQFWAYTRDVHSDVERAREMRDRIIREAEKHTKYKITFEDTPGMTPIPVPGTEGG